jgi:hypothetical protein
MLVVLVIPAGELRTSRASGGSVLNEQIFDLLQQLDQRGRGAIHEQSVRGTVQMVLDVVGSMQPFSFRGRQVGEFVRPQSVV